MLPYSSSKNCKDRTAETRTDGQTSSPYPVVKDSPFARHHRQGFTWSATEMPWLSALKTLLRCGEVTGTKYATQNPHSSPLLLGEMGATMLKCSLVSELDLN